MIQMLIINMLYNEPIFSKVNNAISAPLIIQSQTTVDPSIEPTIEPITMPYDVPLFSQISDISSVNWKQKGCGVADIAMLIEFYKPNTTTVQKVLEEGLASGAYLKNVGWKHDGLAKLATKYDLIGKTHDFSKSDKITALIQLKDIIKEGPAIASIRRGFNPTSSFGHLIVVTGFDDKLVYYNDPGKKEGIRNVPISEFMNGWKKRLIVVRPPATKIQIAKVG